MGRLERRRTPLRGDGSVFGCIWIGFEAERSWRERERLEMTRWMNNLFKSARLSAMTRKAQLGFVWKRRTLSSGFILRLCLRV